ncbi:hypothetical protein BHM03_00039328 [Ensete ventricosum]|nr:hypothetical protein BHM03_00039328 [Ensete ventricosum]
MAATTRYWIVSLPVHTSASATWNRLRESISKNSFDTPLYRVIHPLPFSLSLGLVIVTVPSDSLLALSDDLVKVIRLACSELSRLNFAVTLNLLGSDLQSNAFIEGVTHKIRRQIEELEKASGVEVGALTVDGVPIDSYLTRSVFCASTIESDCFFFPSPFDDLSYW